MTNVMDMTNIMNANVIKVIKGSLKWDVNHVETQQILLSLKLANYNLK